MQLRTKTTRIRRSLAVLALPLLLGACDSLLSVDNPALIQGEDIDDPALVDAMVNGVVGEFQQMYTDQAHYVGIFTDELVSGGTYFANRPWDKRLIDAQHPYVESRYTAVHGARGVADSLGARIRTLLGDEAGTSLGLAKTLAYGGYAYTLLGEQFCQSPIDLSEPKPPAELLRLGIDRFDQAIDMAQAAKSSGADASSADPIINLARVGAARASLQLGEDERAIGYASDVPGDFEYKVPHSDNSTAQHNPFFEQVTNLDKLGVDERFFGLDDPRVPHEDEQTLLEDGRMGYEPFQPYAYSGWSPDDDVEFGRATDLRFASGLEARYIIAEAGGLSDAELRAFIDERRAVGGQGAFAGADSELFDELLDQRGRDFFLDGHRLGDLRRYKAEYGIDRFPAGDYPQTNEVYADAECIPIPASERNSNPNVPSS